MRRRNRRRGRFEETEGLNPMNYLSNLSDVMLVLAVGIMVALVLHWKVPIGTEQSSDTVENESGDTVTFTEDELDSQEEIPENMQRMGDVYYDAETGTYYILQNAEGGE